MIPKPKLDIPVPRINDVESYERDNPANYKAPRSYVRCHRLTPEEWDQTLEYVADKEDEAWLKANTKFGGAANNNTITNNNDSTSEEEKQQTSQDDEKEKSTTTTTTNNAGSSTTSTSKIVVHRRRPQLTLNMFERMMDAMEKETGFEAIITSNQADNIFRIKVPQLYHMFPLKPPRSNGNDGIGIVVVATVKQVVHDVYQYWIHKRSKLKRPLLRRFWPTTSTMETNPNLCFRPREKEKYKLRKKRQNDMDAFRKMTQLRNDFDNLRSVLELVQRREELGRLHVKLQIDRFQQRLYDAVDTSGKPRASQQLTRNGVEQLLSIPNYFETQASSSGVGHKASNKRSRTGMTTADAVSSILPGGPSGRGPTPVHGTAATAAAAASTSGMAALDPATGNIMTAAAAVAADGSIGGAAVGVPLVVAGHNHGEPAPNFMQPLNSRESFVSSWEGAVPHVTSYVDSQSEPTFRFRHRPRVGRGGRLVIDRLPLPPTASAQNDDNPATAPVTVLVAGKGMVRSTQPKARLLDLLPRPLDHEALSRRVEEMCVAAIREDLDTRTATMLQQAAAGPHHGVAASAATDHADENAGDEIIVKLDDWLDTDDQIWGEERHVMGPI